MFTLQNIKEFLSEMGIVWNYEYLMALGVVATAKTPEDITSNHLAKVFVVEENGIKQEIKVGVNEHKFIIYKTKNNGVFSTEKEENVSLKWQEFLKIKLDKSQKQSLER